MKNENVAGQKGRESMPRVRQNLNKDTAPEKHLLGTMTTSTWLQHNYTGGVARNKNFIFFHIRCLVLAKGLGLDPAGSERALKDCEDFSETI